MAEGNSTTNLAAEATTSLWMAQTEVLPEATPLQESIRCDVAVIGSGIAGLSAAYELSEAGLNVAVLDRGKIAGGVTARTTAHLASVCDDGAASLVKMRGEVIAKLFQASQDAAIARIEQLVETHRIDCNFRRVDAYLIPGPGMEFPDARKQQDDEYDALRKLGVQVEKGKGVPLKGYETAPVLHYRNLATFHPLRYLRGLARATQAKGVRFHAFSPVSSIEEEADAVVIRTENGANVTAGSAIVATNTPINDRFALHSKMAPYRTFAMAFTLPQGTIPDALYWDMADPYHYVRLNPGPGTSDYLIVGGADHKSGEADDGAVRFEAIEAWIRALLPELGKEVHRWSGQVMDTIDYCAFIGRNPGDERVFVATGDSGQGITHGVVAGLLLKDLVRGERNDWEEVYDPSRKPVAGALNYLRENMTALKNASEYLMPGEISSEVELEPGQGGIMRKGVHRIAVCRDRTGKVHKHEAACTHLGCQVHWNSTEQCWDCPCHGSHFAPDGSVLNGPATTALKPWQG
jgi:glycine/D-amino acid oxidase-like deaminating enzyme/nitrite reductase/ring-hydroxylating ferredoxin subunit